MVILRRKSHKIKYGMKPTQPDQDHPHQVTLPDGRTYPRQQLLTEAIQKYETSRRTYNLAKKNQGTGHPRQVYSGRLKTAKYTEADAVWAANQSVDAMATRYGVSRAQAYGIRSYLIRMYGDGSGVQQNTHTE
jgi:hypothetical protein